MRNSDIIDLVVLKPFRLIRRWSQSGKVNENILVALLLLCDLPRR